MGEVDVRELERRKLYEREKTLVHKVKEVLEEHLEGRMRFIVYSPYNLRGEDWIWGLGPDFEGPRRGFPWIETVFAYSDGKIYIDLGSCDLDFLISEQHPKIFERLVKEGGEPKETVGELTKVIGELQHRENWKKYRRMIPKVIKYFVKCESIAEAVGRKHGACVEFVISGDRCGVHAVVDTENMSEDEKVGAIMKAATALRDFNDRLHSEV